MIDEIGFDYKRVVGKEFDFTAQLFVQESWRVEINGTLKMGPFGFFKAPFVFVTKKDAVWNPFHIWRFYCLIQHLTFASARVFEACWQITDTTYTLKQSEVQIVADNVQGDIKLAKLLNEPFPTWYLDLIYNHIEKHKEVIGSNGWIFTQEFERQTIVATWKHKFLEHPSILSVGEAMQVSQLRADILIDFVELLRDITEKTRLNEEDKALPGLLEKALIALLETEPLEGVTYGRRMILVAAAFVNTIMAYNRLKAPFIPRLIASNSLLGVAVDWIYDCDLHFGVNAIFTRNRVRELTYNRPQDFPVYQILDYGPYTKGDTQ